MRRLLLLSVSAGAGHSRAAEALRAEAQASFPKVEAKHIDLMTLVPQSFRALYANYYIKIVEHHPSVWAYLYHATDRMPRDVLFAKTRRTIERLNTRKLHDLLKEFAPDHIICTHFLPAELLAHDIKRGRAVPPVWVQITDFDLHRMWVQSGMRGYFAASGLSATVSRDHFGVINADVRKASTSAAMNNNGNMTVMKNLRPCTNSLPIVVSGRPKNCFMTRLPTMRPMLVPRNTAGSSSNPCGTMLNNESHSPRVCADSENITPRAMPFPRRKTAGMIPNKLPSKIASTVFKVLFKNIAAANSSLDRPRKFFIKPTTEDSKCWARRGKCDTAINPMTMPLPKMTRLVFR